ncbi:hypothetical protein [Microlunatus parietis]|uniref:Uncharacterized protein n=1 Tax=Microlunatus parietis TaxID=682979 RepID=A0A7Y9LB68_9ACTN|nr:hypothetical protein [Microlunatus parietis]NYE73589.1 hypothetical protein [Microlunatus parietis]
MANEPIDKPARNHALDTYRDTDGRQRAATVPCPWWCLGEPGHPYTVGNHDAVNRRHELEVGTVSGADGLAVRVVIIADEFGEVGRVELLPPVIEVSADAVRLTAGEAEALATVAYRASLRLGRIAAGA